MIGSIGEDVILRDKFSNIPAGQVGTLREVFITECLVYFEGYGTAKLKKNLLVAKRFSVGDEVELSRSYKLCPKGHHGIAEKCEASSSGYVYTVRFGDLVYSIHSDFLVKASPALIPVGEKAWVARAIKDSHHRVTYLNYGDEVLVENHTMLSQKDSSWRAMGYVVSKNGVNFAIEARDLSKVRPDPIREAFMEGFKRGKNGGDANAEWRNFNEPDL